MSGPKAEPDDNESLTVAGCILTAMSFLVILGSAVPIVHWRSPAGQPLPRVVAIVSPLLIGAAFHSIGSALLWLVGLRVTKTEARKGEQDWPEL